VLPILSTSLSISSLNHHSRIVSIVCSDIVPLRSRGTWQGKLLFESPPSSTYLNTLGIINIVFATGSSTGAPLGGFLADSIGWRWYVRSLLKDSHQSLTSLADARSFLIQVVITIFAIISVSLALDLPRTDNTDLVGKLKRVDFAGAATLVSMTFALLLGLDRGGNISWSDNITLISLVLFVVLFALFMFIETTSAKEPFAPSRIIFNRSLIAGYLVNFFGLAAALTSFYNISLYLQAALGKTASEAGLWLLPSIVSGVLGSLVGGLIMQVTGVYYVLTVMAYMFMLIGTGILPLATGALGHSGIGILAGKGI
jgi:MFS family permease